MDGHHSTDVTNHNQANITFPRGYPTVLLSMLWVFLLRDKHDAPVEREPVRFRIPSISLVPIENEIYECRV